MSFDFQPFPHWAMVAFAARCARRAQIAVLAIAKHFSEKDLETINRIITQVEDAATNAKIQNIDIDSEIQIIRNFIEILSNKKQGSGSMGPFDFAKAAIMCIDNSLNLIKSKNAQLAAATSNMCIAACGFQNDSGAPIPVKIVNSVFKDYECLKKSEIADNWTDDTSVPSNLFGPLWPDGIPDGWSLKQQATFAKNSVLAYEKHLKGVEQKSESIAVSKEIYETEFNPNKLITDHFSRVQATLSNNVERNWTSEILQRIIKNELENLSNIASEKMNISISSNNRESIAVFSDDLFISISTFPCSIKEAKVQYYSDGYLPYLDKMMNYGQKENPGCHWIHIQFFWDGSKYWIQLTIFPNKEYLNFNPMYILPLELLSQKEKLETGLA
ncbi:MAG: hypothetical protein ACQERU_05725 [Bacteroidota bacterium]